MNLKLIKTETDYEAALARLDAIFEAEPGTLEGDEAELLTTLIEMYEEKVYPIEQPTPLEAIQFRIEQQGLKNKDQAPLIAQLEAGTRESIGMSSTHSQIDCPVKGSQKGADTICFTRKDLRGSRLRCLIFTSGSRAQVAQRLTALAHPYATIDPDKDHWAPRGFLEPEEVRLGQASSFLSPDQCKELTNWWLKTRKGANTPNWDIASTCSVSGRPGILLVEAKAHDTELINEEGDKKLKPGCSQDSRNNHEQIGFCIARASAELTKATGLQWNLSHGSHYQMSNRFAWACKLTELGLPVVLIYLGFLNADEMTDCGTPFATPADWTRCVHDHSKSLFPASVWNTQLAIHDVSLAPLLRTLPNPFNP